MNIERLKISELNLDPNNARKHDEANLKAIEGSLRQFGQRKPIVVTAKGIVVAGNGTVTAAKRLGWTEIEAVRTPADWTPDQIKAFALADNRTAELAQWEPVTLDAQLEDLQIAGFDIESIGFKVKTLEMPTELESADEVPRLDQREPKECPSCGARWRETPRGIEIV